jgi:hypothetical protein
MDEWPALRVGVAAQGEVGRRIAATQTALGPGQSPIGKDLVNRALGPR